MKGDENPHACRLHVLHGVHPVQVKEISRLYFVHCRRPARMRCESDNWITTSEDFHLALCLFLSHPRRGLRSLFRAKSWSWRASFRWVEGGYSATLSTRRLLLRLVGPEGFEPSTPGAVFRCSCHLSYRPMPAGCPARRAINCLWLLGQMFGSPLSYTQEVKAPFACAPVCALSQCSHHSRCFAADSNHIQRS